MAARFREALALRDSMSAQLNDAYDFCQRAITEPQLRPLAKMRLARTSEIYKELCQIHIDMTRYIATKDPDSLDQHEQIRLKFTKLFEGIEETLVLFDPSVFEPQPVETSQVNVTNIPRTAAVRSLPTLELPHFDGTFKAWPSFIAQFDSSVHQNQQLADIEKFRYLLSLLQGEPLNLIRSLTLSEANYPIAYVTLQNRYQNDRMLSSYYWSVISGLPSLTMEGASSLRGTVDKFSEFKAAIDALNLPDVQDFLWFSLLLDKIDPQTRRAFECTRRDNPTRVPSFKDLQSFLEAQSQVLATTALEQKPNMFYSRGQGSRPLNGQRADTLRQRMPHKTALVTTTVDRRCALCGLDHAIQMCTLFKSKPPQERFKICKANKLCINCLQSSHRLADCNSSYSCRHCGVKHHSLLHFNAPNLKGESSARKGCLSPQRSPSHGEKYDSDQGSSPTTPMVALTTSLPDTKDPVFLPTAVIEVQDSYGHFHPARALLDTCSEASFISRRLANQLNHRSVPSHITVMGIDHNSSGFQSSGLVTCHIRSRVNTSAQIEVCCHVLPQIAGKIPARDVSGAYPQFQGHTMADPDFHRSSGVDLLLGGDIYTKLITPLVVQGKHGHPSAFGSIFGLVVSGSSRGSSHQPHCKITTCFTQLIADPNAHVNLDVTIRKFWEMEEPPSTPPVKQASAELYCEKLFKDSTFRDTTGRFTVSLPFKQPQITFKNSYEIALKRFLSLERRLGHNQVLRTEYNDFMHDYIAAGHMSVSHLALGEGSFYIPHHCVIKSENGVRKIRVVFDASCKDANGLSLNDTLVAGPTLIQDLVTILLRFRLHKVVFTADIRQMYRQIKVTKNHYTYQQILWRSSPDEDLKAYTLNTVTYGVASSPYLAMRVLRQLASTEEQHYPLAAELLRSSMYVDDVVAGAGSVETAIELRKQLVDLLNAGQFELRKWASNSPKVLDGIDDSHQVNSLSFDCDQPILPIKILGLQWIPNEDAFSFAVQPEARACTKRALLSQLARTFDPVGFLTPLTFFAKSLIQRLWCIGLDWDAEPPTEITSLWKKYLSQLGSISRIRIPRLCLSETGAVHEVHGFSDASEAGFAAVVYMRVLRGTRISTHILTSKSKVAPLKRRPLPQLELCGAYLLAKLISFVLTALDGRVSIASTFAWCDSTIALSWIRCEPYRLKTFIANRVSYIQEVVPPSSWRHVPSKQNPADPASRGLLPEELVSCQLWFSGPEWLLQCQDCWPQLTLPSLPEDQNFVDQSRAIALVTAVAPHEAPIMDDFVARFSSLSRLQNAAAYMLRLIAKIKRQPYKVGPITATERKNALMWVTKHVQRSSFAEEIRRIETGQVLDKHLQRLSCFIDDQGVIRVGGRIANSSLGEDAKHPALLPKGHHFTKLIISYTHLVYLHPGRRTLHYLILQNFWILSANRTIRTILNQCNRCFRVNPRTVVPTMANLPRDRVLQAKPFSHVGIDFGGPFAVTMTRSRGSKHTKAYLCLFVCFATKALHLELASSLSTECFLAAFRRFIARRGRCSRIYTDRGTNFVGAARQLKKIFSSALQAEGIDWSFNPPSAPHFGGLWETGIRSVKTHLRRVIGDQVLSYEELNTSLIQIEALLNSRPLCEASDDPNDLSALTPGHFLTLAPLSCLPDDDVINVPLNRLSRWQLLQRLQQSFWNRWHKEYLNTIQQRFKWNRPIANIAHGSLVLVKDDNLPPMQWHLGRVTDTHPGSDGIVRTVTLRTVNGVLLRPVVKLCPLPSQ